MQLHEQRQQELEKVFRYGSKEHFFPVYYRPNLRIHTTRVLWITREITQYLDTINNSIYSSSMAQELAMFHDDTELITGDIVSVDKDKFSTSDKESFENKMEEAIEVLTKKYDALSQHGYKKLLHIDKEKQGIEYTIVAYADKLDAHLEICHELFAGNPLFMGTLTRFGLDDIDSYVYTRNKIIKLLQELSHIFWEDLEWKHPLFQTSQMLDVKKAVLHGQPFTKDNIRHKTGYTMYDTWKELHFLYWTYREKEYLYTQKESL